jgi:hypothetical protein
MNKPCQYKIIVNNNVELYTTSFGYLDLEISENCCKNVSFIPFDHRKVNRYLPGNLKGQLNEFKIFAIQRKLQENLKFSYCNHCFKGVKK